MVSKSILHTIKLQQPSDKTTLKVFFTGDAEGCPICNQPIIGNDPTTHHTHDLEYVKTLCTYYEEKWIADPTLNCRLLDCNKCPFNNGFFK